MNKLYLIGVLALTAVATTSCDHLLNDNRYPLSQQVVNPLFWSNASNVIGQTNYLYENYLGYGNGSGSGNFYWSTLSDDQVTTVGGSFRNWTYTTTPSTSSSWTSPYTEIRRCNLIIEGVASGTLTDAEKANFTAIARLNRAYQYYQLVRAYGDVPLVSAVIDTDSEELYAPRDNRDDVMDFALEDLNYAKDNIATKSSKTEWSRDLAEAMKAEICLFEAAYAKYNAGNSTRANKYYNEVIAACEALMPSYTLNADYATNYQSVRSEMEANKEVIFAKMYEKGVFMHSLMDYSGSSTPIAGISKDAFDAYLFKDGKPLALTSENKSDVGEMVDGNYSIQKLLDVRDSRLSVTTYPCAMYTGQAWGISNTMLMTSTSGYGVAKYNDRRIAYDDAMTANKNYTCAPLYWLAEIYLAYAEAKAELGTLTDADLNNTINKLYARADLPNQTIASLSGMNDPANNMGISSLLWEIRRCRRCELIMDNNIRYWDLVRWNQLELLDNTTHPNIMLGINVSAAAVAPTRQSGDYLDASMGLTRKFTDREKLYPIPTNQITLNSNLVQNPGWSAQ